MVNTPLTSAGRSWEFLLIQCCAFVEGARTVGRTQREAGRIQETAHSQGVGLSEMRALGGRAGTAGGVAERAGYPSTHAQRRDGKPRTVAPEPAVKGGK